MIKKGVKCNHPCYFKNKLLMKKDRCILINIKPKYIKDCPCRICLISPICTVRCDASHKFIEDYHEIIYEEVKNKNMSEKELGYLTYLRFFKMRRERKSMFYIEDDEEIKVI